MKIFAEYILNIITLLNIFIIVKGLCNVLKRLRQEKCKFLSYFYRQYTLCFHVFMYHVKPFFILMLSQICVNIVLYMRKERLHSLCTFSIISIRIFLNVNT